MKKVILTAFFYSFLLAEPSAFEAGNLDSNQPYGLSEDEKYIFKNKQNIKKLDKLLQSHQKILNIQKKELDNLKLKLLKYKIQTETISQRLNGIDTILPFFDTLSVDVKQLKKDVKFLKESIDELQKNMQILRDVVNLNKETEDKNSKNIIDLVENLATHIDKMSLEIEKLKKEKKDFRNWKKYKIFNEAVNLFKKYNYTKAKEMFSYLYEIKYKPATTLFYLGEIEYKRGHYKKALSFYKNSIKIYSKTTSFTAELLYHTGYSFEKLGNKKGAKNSYLKILNDYPNSIFVKYAKKRLNNLEKKE